MLVMVCRSGEQSLAQGKLPTLARLGMPLLRMSMALTPRKLPARYAPLSSADA